MKLKTDNIFFTGDLHFFHTNVIKYCSRPFTDAEEMNEALIANWNNKVGPQDSIFLLGDVSFAKPPQTETVLKRLNGNIYLIKGNHDWSISSLSKYFAWVKELVTIEVPDSDVKGGYRPVALCHYPLLTWDRMRYGSWNFFGHVHEKWLGNNRQINVGVDKWDFTPVSYNEIKKTLETLPPQTMYMD